MMSPYCLFFCSFIYSFLFIYFFQTTIQDLFDVNINENDPTKRMSDVLDKTKQTEEVSMSPYLNMCMKSLLWCNWAEPPLLLGHSAEITSCAA